MPDFSDHKIALDLLKQSQDADEDNRELAKEAHIFVTKPDGQWEPEWFNANDGKPRYTFDQTSPIIDQISGDIDDSDFDIQIKPAGGTATKELAQLRDGMIRNIETISNAQTIYSIAGRNVVTAGIDHWMVSTKFVDEDSFDKDLVIEPIHNSSDRVWFDVGSQMQDRSDSNWGFLLSAIPTEEAEERFPDRSIVSVGDNQETAAYFNKPDTVIIGHIFFRKLIDRVLIKTSLERIFAEDDKWEKIKDELAAAGETEDDRRTKKESVFFVRKFDASDWIGAEEELVFSSIPLVPVYANFKVIENKTVYHGVVQKLMDPQRILNYSLSREIEEGALAPRAKYWMTNKQTKGHTKTLRTMNTNADPVQNYTPDPAAPGPPTQQGGAQINPGLRTISEGMQQIMGRTSGIFAAGMGDNPNFQSGIAIEKLQRKSNNVTSKYFNSLEIAICRTGELLEKALPKVYDVERQIRILNEDGSFEMTIINQTVVDEETGEPVMINDLSAGKYDVTCKAGKSFDSRQSETVSTMLELAQVDPTILQLGADVLLNNMSQPGMEKIADRQRKQLFEANIIPEDQMTDEEIAQVQAAAQQPPQPDAALVLAQAEQAKADAQAAKVQVDLQKIQLENQKAQNRIALDVQKLQLAQRKIELDAQQRNIEFSEKIAKLDQTTQKQEFDQLITLRDQQNQFANDAINNLNTQANTMKTLADAIAASPIQGPGNAVAFIGQTREVAEAQNRTL